MNKSDIENLLREAGAPEAELESLAATAQKLAAADFSGESRIRESLKARLLSPESAPAPRVVCPLRLRFAGALAALLLTAGILFAPAGIASLRDFMKRFALGGHTEVVQLREQLPEPVSTPPPVIRSWLLRTPIGNFGGEVPEGKSAEMVRCNTLAEALKIYPKLLRPAWLPRGYKLRKAMITPESGVLLIYSGAEDDIFLYQLRAGDKTVRRETYSPVEIISRQGKQAVWIPEGYGLIWEEKEVSFTLGGTTLSKKEALKMADSIKQKKPNE